ncbi:hypothetical protein COW36_16275 [bacterium (Candidatus Blackallbacteria) CG17_big_fil_post_rev_8_21_14_2_50_48_46]|uniref:Type II secretion system protein GspG C-terminal domain-containing protein n=1 Tax=bacterium (Candidatus Blackallbacteria) CG17_big_fil_post_rev_8_21_14_2_50_48_46 TaxID=2014261 RepID=A0A2M7G1U1_9BACT|nr:MAG: hypothetical protein COW64_16745 [bacterium (Candidatus Blackallbacteria) CG18_big_fil_WC_8_21_14_2_50_49_26]PIW15692.1 MAG: hypothetical protein COW36_16275 [bacterium (Candidatus Blackallbacteria) CG17_big_fil_post_rev_8_21_14_2_50_48_46]PIW48697.1 MAG: hypothetical protein COW20_08455 [bacterium (Candidatus Blackallbacteria) CG13_big_fil_rev_8_21_14_2_50_49_14]
MGQWGQRMKRSIQKQKGFTLVELMVVIIIIGLLVAIALPNFAAAQDRARNASVKANGHALETIVNTYNIDNGRYPASIPEITGHDSYKTLENPFSGRKGVADASGQGAWRTNNDGDAASAPNALTTAYSDQAISQGLAIYVGLDATGNATTRFLGDGKQGTNNTVNYLIYTCDRSGKPIRGFILSPADLPSEAARDLQRAN